MEDIYVFIWIGSLDQKMPANFEKIQKIGK